MIGGRTIAPGFSALAENRMGTKTVGQWILFLVSVSLFASQTVLAESGGSGTGQVSRGEHLATFGGCNDCHTPKVMTPDGPRPDAARLLSGHRAEVHLPPVPAGVLGSPPWGVIATNELTAWAGPWGISFAANLTPDKATGLGGWTAEQFVKTMRTGKHLGVGRPVLPPMPIADIAGLSDQDLKALFAYLKSLRPVVNQVPPPVPPK